MARKDKKETPAKSSRSVKPEEKKPGTIKQMWQVFTMTRKNDPAAVWWMLLAFVLVVALCVVLGLVLPIPGGWIFMLIFGIITGFMVALIVMGRLAEKTVFAQIEDQPGRAGAALSSIRRGWAVEEQPVAIDPRTTDMVFRAVGRPGVALVSEGPSHRVEKLLDKETKKVERLLPGVPVLTFQTGNDEGQIPLRKIATKLQRQRPKLTKSETAEVMRRLRALGGVKLPVPKGIDPTRVRPDRKGMRGR